jgi:hypothetical protein
MDPHRRTEGAARRRRSQRRTRPRSRSGPDCSRSDRHGGGPTTQALRRPGVGDRVLRHRQGPETPQQLRGRGSIRRRCRRRDRGGRGCGNVDCIVISTDKGVRERTAVHGALTLWGTALRTGSCGADAPPGRWGPIPSPPARSDLSNVILSRLPLPEVRGSSTSRSGARGPPRRGRPVPAVRCRRSPTDRDRSTAARRRHSRRTPWCPAWSTCHSRSARCTSVGVACGTTYESGVTQSRVTDLVALVTAAGADLDRLGWTTADPFPAVRDEIERRVADGSSGRLGFTYSDPARSTTPHRDLAVGRVDRRRTALTYLPHAGTRPDPAGSRVSPNEPLRAAPCCDEPGSPRPGGRGIPGRGGDRRQPTRRPGGGPPGRARLVGQEHDAPHTRLGPWFLIGCVVTDARFPGPNRCSATAERARPVFRRVRPEP